MGARDILLLAAEDAFEFERWREAGPVTAEIDPEVAAAEIVEYEALGIPLPRELDVLRRELEFAPAVRDAIRSSTNVLRRNGRAEASALVGLGPQGLVPWGAGGLDPRLLMMMDPRMAAALDPRGAPAAARAREAAEPRSEARRARAAVVVDEPAPEPERKSESRRARAAIVVDEPAEVAPPERGGSRRVVEPELVDDDDDDDDDDDEDDDDELAPPPRSRRASPARPAKSRERARARARDEDDDDSLIAVAPVASPDRTNTIILATVSAVAVIALLWIAFGRDDEPKPDAQAQVQVQAPVQPAPVQQPPPPAIEQPLVDPALVPMPMPTPTPAPASPGSRGSGLSGSRTSSGSGGSGGSVLATTPAAKPAGGPNPFSGYDANVAAGGQPSAPAAGGQPSAPTPAPAPTPGPAPAATDPAATPAPTPAPAPAPAPVEPELTKSKMTPAIREAITKKVGDMQRCYNDALLGAPGLAGRIVFTISLDQDGVVKKVDVGKDELGYGVAGCVSKKIKTWTLPSAGIPIIFDLPFDFHE